MKSTHVENYPTKYWHKLDDGRVQCDLCPRLCKLREGKRGTCFIRKHYNNQIVLTSYGRSSGFCIDPIEKKPLNHFYPGSKVLSFGTAGCNLICKFCQNWDISKSRQLDALCDTALPESIAQTAYKNGCKSVAFTYNDPVVFFEYAIDVAKACHHLGIKTVAVSAGYICEQPRQEFFRYIDAVNIDLKGFTEHFYHKLCGGQLSATLETLMYIKHQTTTWLEITTLLIPNQNDSTEELAALSKWILNNLGDTVPLHFTAFHPDFKMLDTPKTPKSTLIKARDIALNAGLKYVYIGNVHDQLCENSYCQKCGQVVIERDWYHIGRYQLTRNGQCKNCGQQFPGYFEQYQGAFGPRRIPVRINN